MTDADIKKYRIGRKFTNILNNTKWTITSVNITDDYIWAEDSLCYKCRLFIERFDDFHVFVDEELPQGLYDAYEYSSPAKISCSCGSDSYYGVDKGPHSDYCDKSDNNKKGSTQW